MRPSSKTPVLAVLVAVSPLLGSCAGTAPAAYEARAFIFAFEREGECQLRLGPGTIRAQAGDDVVWEIKNECGRGVEPELRDFTYEGRPDAAAGAAKTERASLVDVFEAGEARRKVAPQSEGEIRLRIRSAAKAGRYSYGYEDLQQPGNPGDPKLDIWPPRR